ncbi:D-alanyl-D-alanine endopeptidase (penicillin-binding protein 7) [Rhodoferax ferrireducens]|uniref:D-alanyl-D-alanine endopeptidase (Penicillin-binding protein 7) n=1 Tax=Rhodoferax ferrireducens TaxID=192843 RepID=A0ABU2C6P7_9BURK|nr:D-alanyl-D-alanine endopeptidase (penicillin-binding protein 7) [Rhodoferax ferrireducens]
MPSTESPALNRLLQIVAIFTCTVTLCAMPAHAAQRKKVEIQKTNAASKVAKRSSGEKSVRVARASKTAVSAKSRVRAPVAIIPAIPSFGELAGLHGAPDALALKSSVALVIDQDTREVLFSKNEQAVLPIASLTKLMTGVVVNEAHLPMDEEITITQDDVDTEKRSRSRLTVGTSLSRGELLHLALMSSENRAAHALGRTYPGGMNTFVALMNAKAKALGMKDTRYVEPTGLSSNNQSSAHDLATLVNAAYNEPTLRELTTSPGYQVDVGSRTLQFNNTNRLVKNPDWDIGIQKTGFINEAGQCLVLQAKIAGRKLIMVFLDSAGKLSRIGDAERVRRWVESTPHVANATKVAG